MFWEFLGEQTDPQPVGSLTFGSDHVEQKNVALVLLKILGVAIILAIGFAVLVPLLPLPLWQSVVLASGIVLLYVGVSFFVHAEPNGDNLGWFGGAIDDPLHYSDDLNRLLFGLHMLLGPGRFVSGTFLDICALCGWLAASDSGSDETMLTSADEGVTAVSEYAPIAPADLDHPTELASARFWNPGQPVE